MDVDRHPNVASTDRKGNAPRRKLRWMLMALATAVVLSVGGFLLGARVKSPAQVAANAAPPTPSWVTAAVEFRVLTQTVITRGDVIPEISATIDVPSSVEGEPVVTGIAVKVGDEVDEGTRLVEVSGRPVFVMQGDVPVYRTLRAGMHGVDVAQLQAALDRLGCAAGDDPGVYGRGTEKCVAALYADAGYDAITTSSATTATVPLGEVVFIPSFPARVRSAVSKLGAVGQGDGSMGGAQSSGLVELAVGELVVSMTLRPDEQPLVRPGTRVELLDEQTNTTYGAVLKAVDDTSTIGLDGQMGFAASITTDGPLPTSLTGANLRVTITAASTETETLVVPVTAISSASDGTTSVSVLPSGAADPVLVPVTVGLSADGFVAIEPHRAGAVSEGDRVVVGR